ncbi:MAG: glutamine-hydrolyzing carbamoyl-phosphate synthase small subunit [Dehalococcoidales bacterium]|jgi:carbamoyl-phosphate synthase small subunit|nr:glutamine-hydrolyzing carbamoyl-phosphate synthase small subunit [Dehalococcoidales bacterium]
MTKRAILVLQDGSWYEGFSFGAEVEASGEVVFNTSMIGYQEILTDPSYAGQIVLPTYPLIGNYGINDLDIESRKIQVSGFIVKEECTEPSHYLCGKTLHEYLAEYNIPGIRGIDTRAITRKLRSHGVMMGYITTRKTPAEALEALRNSPDYGSIDFVKGITTEKPYQWGLPCQNCCLEINCRKRAPGFPYPCGLKSLEFAEPEYKIVALDCGLKYNILRQLVQRRCSVTVVPCTTSAHEILKMNPDGILLSPGPGDPSLLDYAIHTVRELAGKKPIMGICLGNQLIAHAFGGKTFKLKFGHRGGNHPVREFATGRAHITAQNHGYAVDPDSLPPELEVTHINLNDGTVEGLRHRELPIFSIQYHSEDSPGPWDSRYLFDEFINMIKQDKQN